MPKVPALTPEKLIKILTKHSFILDHQTGSHMVYINTTTNKRVVVPYHKKDLPKGTLLSIIKAAGIEEVFKRPFYSAAEIWSGHSYHIPYLDAPCSWLCAPCRSPRPGSGINLDEHC